jgi:hypothetical protein
MNCSWRINDTVALKKNFVTVSYIDFSVCYMQLRQSFEHFVDELEKVVPTVTQKSHEKSEFRIKIMDRTHGNICIDSIVI